MKIGGLDELRKNNIFLPLVISKQQVVFSFNALDNCRLVLNFFHRYVCCYLVHPMNFSHKQLELLRELFIKHCFFITRQDSDVNWFKVFNS